MRGTVGTGVDTFEETFKVRHVHVKRPTHEQLTHDQLKTRAANLGRVYHDFGLLLMVLLPLMLMLLFCCFACC